MIPKRRERDELAGLLPRERADALRRERIVLELNRLLTIGAAEKLKALDITCAYGSMLQSHGLKVSAATLSLWRKHYRSNGLMGLINLKTVATDRRRLERRCPRLLREVLKLYHGARLSDCLPAKRRRYAIDMAIWKAETRGWALATARELAIWLKAKLQHTPEVGPAQRRPAADRTPLDGGSIDN